MNRSTLILIAFMLGNVVARGEVLHQPQTGTAAASHGLIRVDSTSVNAVAPEKDVMTTPVSGNESLAGHTGSLNTGQNLTSNFRQTSIMNTATPDAVSNGRLPIWRIALALMGMVTWQLWRKQKSLRFGESCLAKDTDYAVR